MVHKDHINPENSHYDSEYYDYNPKCVCSLCTRTTSLVLEKEKKARDLAVQKASVAHHQFGTYSSHPKTPTREQQYNEIMKTAKEVFLKKTSDYGNKNDNMVSTLESAAALAGIEVDSLIIGIIANKLERISSLKMRERQVKDETLSDTGVDIVNYAIFLAHSLKGK